MTISAKVVLNSVSPDGVKLTTMELRYPRFIHSEFMTHRVFSRNAASSRAIPTEKIIEAIEQDPAMPVRFGLNGAGMQDAGALSVFGEKTSRQDWLSGCKAAVEVAKTMMSRPERCHKQVINRILEPYAHITTLVSATEWQNFFALRDHPDADPTFQELAAAMKEAYDGARVAEREMGDWHLPFIADEDIVDTVQLIIRNLSRFDVKSEEDVDRVATELLCKSSVARCARVSYLTHDGKRPTLDEDLVLFSKLMLAQPLHASPAEHQATPDQIKISGHNAGMTIGWEHPELHGNFVGWKQYRKNFVGEAKHDNTIVKLKERIMSAA